jgi:hypothetical protein
MHSVSVLLLSGVAWFALTGCENRHASFSDKEGAESRVNIADFGIDTTTTLGDWMKSNPRDTISARYPLYSDDDWFCSTEVGHPSLSGHRTIRYAVFRISAPIDGQLPRDTVKTAEQVCRLGTVWVETEGLDSLTANLLVDSVTKVIDAKLGDHESGTRLTPGATTGWADSRTWNRQGSRTILTTARADGKETARKVILAAYGRGSALPDQDYFFDKYYQDQADALETKQTSLQDADSAIAWAGLPSIAKDLRVALAELRRNRDNADTLGNPTDDSTVAHAILGTQGIRTRNNADTLRNPIADSALVRAVLATRDTAPTLVPPRQAAALIAAELVRYAAVPYPPPNSGSPAGMLFTSLQSILAGYEVQGVDLEHSFSRPWLWKAYELDSLGKAGHIAFVRLLSRAFDERKECALGIDFYNEMINRGEAELRRGDHDPLVHFYVGAAYKSIFDLGNSASGDYVDSIPSKKEAETARLRAIEHFRMALGSLRDRPMRRDTWEMAARLLLRKPGRPWLFCEGEDD